MFLRRAFCREMPAIRDGVRSRTRYLSSSTDESIRSEKSDVVQTGRFIMLLVRLLASVSVALTWFSLLIAATRPRSGRRLVLDTRQVQTDGYQDVVTWDEYSLMINGTRLFIWGGEVHPYRMPVQSLHLDVFQKIKAMGLNAVSFYVFWGIHEPKRGEISWEGFRDLQPFIDAAMEAGLYLIARPGPYINAETTAGGFPGWGTYTPGLWRTENATYYDAWQEYMAQVGGIIAKNQISNGGPIILTQLENEYSLAQAPLTEDFTYERQLIDAIRAAGVTVPTTHNDAWPHGSNDMVDIYGYDSYPNGFDCAHPYTWASDAVANTEYFWGAHLEYNPEDPNAVYEFQGGAFDPWGGSGYENCAVLLGPEFERVFYKHELAMSTTLLNLYMAYGGTNWGGIAHPGVYTSYDYGSAIAEDRTLREKYYELKLQASFISVSPAFLTGRPQNVNAAQAAFTGNPALTTHQVLDVVGNQTGFYIVAQNDTSSTTSVSYRLTVPSSKGSLSIPQLGGSLTLNGRDSKIHVVDYSAGSTTLLYSTAEIMTWATIGNRDVVVLYGNSGELHETAIKASSAANAKVVSGTGNVKQANRNGTLVIQYTTSGQTVVEIGSSVLLYILDRTEAYEFWILHTPGTGAYAAFNAENPVIVKGGYLLRSVSASDGTLALKGDLNGTTSFEIIAPSAITKRITFNGDSLSLTKTKYGTLVAKKNARLPAVTLPHLATAATWKTANSLPEISSAYSDAPWTTADHNSTVNPTQSLTPVVLYAGDYGYHTGNILWRAHFNASGAERGITLNVQGGSAFGYSVWLDSSFLGSWEGNAVNSSWEQTFPFKSTTIRSRSTHVITILQDHMGYEEDWTSASDDFKTPRGILSYSFVGSNSTVVGTWKVTGNLGGESYADSARGPLNEGGLFAERQGWHLPGFDDSKWAAGKPTSGISQAGVAFYRTTFSLDVPTGVDYPIGISITNSTRTSHFRAQLYVNGYQFGKYVNHIGPQSVFPVPEGILNYHGENTLAVSLWAQDASGAKLESIDLQVLAKLDSSMPAVTNQPMPKWSKRPGAY
ncbi:hypothetical protein PUNSTDRAFT_146007 [Punctularia strigosozonata HHB-11173 SS5]|uniref:Beta-galactosidase n=1 Tax=Punctularia strigosozonata (strain HHB-11173) TaxID=741275 RepID=R7S3W7_PUNST|nr:uncharacterized protein PUNSTDRAFT_146007 [Punctularia strigosozonata HHB-11173 SS5]EIN05080.1 hypothetical protein PUNSTDRAFT_146007 [Punctularia strigosozonata HHB-11173 SS5]